VFAGASASAAVSSRSAFSDGLPGSVVVDEQDLLGVVSRGEGLVGDGEVADQRVVVALGAGGALVDPLVGPVAAELRALDGQLADERAERRVIGVAAGVEAQHGGGVGGDGRPVRVQLPGVRVEEDEPGLVAVRGGQGPEVGDQPAGEAVVGEHVQAPAEDKSRAQHRFEGVEQVEGDGVDPLRAGPALALGRDGPREGVQVGSFRVVEVQGGGQRVEDRGGRARAAALFEARVVVDAHAGQPGEFLPPQPGHATAAGALLPQPRVVRAEPGARGTQELGQCGRCLLCGHDRSVGHPHRHGRGEGGPIRPPRRGIDSPRIVGTALYSGLISYDDLSRTLARRAA
jgi:hypothetical protein